MDFEAMTDAELVVAVRDSSHRDMLVALLELEHPSDMLRCVTRIGDVQGSTEADKIGVQDWLYHIQAFIDGDGRSSPAGTYPLANTNVLPNFSHGMHRLVETMQSMASRAAISKTVH
jgi:hypothetical protein